MIDTTEPKSGPRNPYMAEILGATPANTHTRVLDLTQVAELLSCHPKTVRLMAQDGRIPGFRVGRLWRFSAMRIQEWIDTVQAA